MSNQTSKFLLVIILIFIPNIFANAAHATYTKCRNSDASINKYCFKLGDRGIYIQRISSLLNEFGYYDGRSKTLFDKELERSVVKFQRDYRLKSTDGIVGNETLLHMCKVSRGCKPNAGPSCYIGSPRIVVNCLNDFKPESEKNRSYSDGR
jgi:Putative peptidoglycan binding domain